MTPISCVRRRARLFFLLSYVCNTIQAQIDTATPCRSVFECAHYRLPLQNWATIKASGRSAIARFVTADRDFHWFSGLIQYAHEFLRERRLDNDTYIDVSNRLRALVDVSKYCGERHMAELTDGIYDITTHVHEDLDRDAVITGLDLCETVEQWMIVPRTLHARLTSVGALTAIYKTLRLWGRLSPTPISKDWEFLASQSAY